MTGMADRDHVLRHVERPPRRIPEVMRLSRRPLAAPLAQAGCSLENDGADRQEARVLEVFAVRPVGHVLKRKRRVGLLMMLRSREVELVKNVQAGLGIKPVETGGLPGREL